MERRGTMPACMAHYQFGQEALDRLDADIRSIVLAYKGEYDIGLQGPDIFFYCKPYAKNAISNYGSARHAEPAYLMFSPILEKAPERAAFSYLLGLICHYALDRRCHPYVNGHSRDLSEHMEMESAFDRYIMESRALKTARYHCIPPSGPDYGAMASLWTGMTETVVRSCTVSLRRYTWLLDHKRIRSICEAAVKRSGAFAPMSLPDGITGKQAGNVRRLDTLYERALNEYPELIRTAVGCLGGTQPACPGFELNYEGEAADEQA